MQVTVLVPHDDGIAGLADVDRLRPVLYRGGDSLPSEAAEAEVLIPSTRGPAEDRIVRSLPSLKLIQLLSAGAEEWIGAVPDGVLLSTCRGAHGASTAEWVVAALLSLYRDFPGFTLDRQARAWHPRTTETLQDKRVVVVGAGDLGGQLARRLAPFDVQPRMVGLTAREDVRGVDQLPDLLPMADAVVLTVPLTSRTRGMVDADFLARMPDGAVLVNASRGAVVSTEALVAELRARRLRAALDVTDPEPLPNDHPLWTAPGVLLTPHVAGAVHGQRRRAYAVAAGQIAQWLAGELPDNLVHGEY